MEINMKFNKRAKLVSSFVNIFLVLAVLVVLFPLSTPTVKADTLWYDNWDIWNGEDITLDDDTIILNGTLWVHEGGKLTLDNCKLSMRYKYNLDNLIKVDGEFNVTNNSLITIYSSELTDRYEFKIYYGGKALIEDSTVEYMAGSQPVDGIEIYSNDVTIKSSTIQKGSGNGITISDSDVSPRISHSNIIDNGLVAKPRNY